MRNNFYKFLDITNSIYLIFLGFIFIVEIILNTFNCGVSYGDNWDVEHFNIHEIFCDNYLFEKIDYILLNRFFELKYTFEFYFIVISFGIFFIFIFNLIHDLLYISKQKLVFKNIFKKISFYGLFLNLLFYYDVY